MNIGHIAGVCLSFLGSISYPPILFTGLLFLFFFLALAKILFSWLKMYWFKKSIQTAKIPQYIQDVSLKHDLGDKIIIFRNTKPSAFCLGIKDAKIYLSTKLLEIMSGKEIEAIILHEKYHLLNKGTFLVLIATFFRELFLLFPILTDVAMSFIRQKETEADGYALSYFKNPDIVLSAFKKLISHQETNPSFAYLVSFVHTDTLEHRIKILKGEKSLVLSFKIRHILVSFISFVAISILLIFTSKPVSAHQNISPSVCLKGHNCHSECSS
ncbi:hypothetical protein A2866_00260 [Candidatus Roizmanbacteria bacterium RIFCSPHIGHO2_01_FULL_39_8]|uniref:Peptidase M56 domain-containing protein n=2 Tax=Candidatus Roizmaniibacteriota TaxID=1752723 RepID=A0A1F7GQ46_9BACT|nr:MAG: hypothetical protein A2866_00260 [Candidatus Roizmanbacteria bacterium RIFCSPHIGHO2_01_FULL_39_8]OGK26030.1 MAG: hypothetical protein A3C28_02145 [Candidatus Roizmanbacteria bacterium RIFCSPHIGHO2_02_FULL_39_9]